ncbi:MAG: YihY/virulence factor BrkB family protein [Bryobacteraceae bacterium]
MATWLLRRSFIAAYEDGCFGVAKGAAYSALLCLFPLLTTTATVLVQIRAEPVWRLLSRILAHAVPPGTETAVLESFRAQGERPFSLLVAASLISLWAASRVMTSFMEGFQAIYRIPRGRPFFQCQMMAILLVLCTAAPVALGLILVLFGVRVEGWVMRQLGVVPASQELEWGVAVAAKVVRYAVALGAGAGAAAVLYSLGPNRPQQWRFVWPGALLSTLLWFSSTLAFGWYVRNIADYNLLYGSVGAAIALVVWLYVLAAVALLGCEFNAELERLSHALGRG